MLNESGKIKWKGEILSIQPRTRVWRYVTDNRTHYHIGYNLFIKGESSVGKESFVVAISQKQQFKNDFSVGDVIEGTAWLKKYDNREFADYYKAGSLKHISMNTNNVIKSEPWIIKVPTMDVYEGRGARILSKSLWKGKCFKCIWANMANVEIQWDFDKNIKKYRFEAFCYGPKSCSKYKMGKPPVVPYKNRDSAIDDGSLDELCTEGRYD